MRNRFSRVVFALLLVLAGALMSALCLDETHVTSLLFYHDDNVFHTVSSGPIVAGKTIVGEFQAQYANLAMVKLRISTFHRLNTTHIRFALREKGEDSWLISNTYTVDRFPDGLLYPFGFPVIFDSKGKTYEFVIESPDGTPDNTIGIKTGYHDMATQYVFQKSALLSDRKLLREFVAEKAKSMISDWYILLYMSIFMLPAVVFYIKRYGEVFAVYALFVYTYIPLSLHSNTILFMATLAAFFSFYLRTASSHLYLAALLWLVQIPLSVAFGNMLAADRAATLVFFLFLIGGIISLAELKRK